LPAAGMLPGPALRPVPLLPAADRGRRKAQAPVSLAIVLRYDHRRELMHLVDGIADPRSPSFRRFLTPSEFNARFAPRPQQYARVLGALRASGFTIVRTYADRALIDARAPSRIAERFFRTRIHDFDQGRYGVRYANVTPLHLPAAIAPLVADVELNSIVYARAAVAAGSVGPATTTTVNEIKNGGFEKKLDYWKSCDKVALSTLHPFAGKYSALVGSVSKTAGVPHGLQVLCQRVIVPLDGVLRARTYSVTNVKKIAKSYQVVGLMSAPGRVVKVLRKQLVNRPGWQFGSWRLGAYGGQRLYVFFAVYGHGQKAQYDSMFVDNVSLIGGVPPSPSPTPSSSPTPVGPGPGKPLTGPTFGPNGAWAPRGVADGFDLPVQHGYDGSGVTVGVVMQSAVLGPDLATFLSVNGITRQGNLSETPVAGGPKSGDPTEGMLQIETIAALAPGANVVAYETPDLSNLSIVDAYQAALNAAHPPSVLDSAFGECDSDDASFDSTVENDAIAGAAKGITFVAAGGDEGAACYSSVQNRNVQGTQIPASAPHVLAVGGNDSLTSGSIANPVAWNGDNGFFVGASGGGISAVWPIPSYQQGVAGAPASSTHRNVPDVSFPAVDDDLRLHAADEIVGGTAWSSAIAAALLAQAVQICGKFGFADPAVYALFAAHGEGTNFLDVTSGDNHYASIPGYDAVAGYDDASGIGMPNGFHFATALCGRTIAASVSGP
jgi:subtilase family serine protease